MTIDQFSIGDNTASYTRAKCDHDKIFHPFCCAIHHFTYGSCIGIIG